LSDNGNIETQFLNRAMLPDTHISEF
jgi:hypothetical protein